MDVVNNEAEQRFEIALEDGSVAFAEYRMLKGKVMFPHTVVPSKHEGQGLGSRIAKVSLEWVREQGLLAIPACTFYLRYMQRHPETHDLLEPELRGQFAT
ncbi:GNAT family N-acetyltransferase [Sphingomonas swuensis]|uniref:GNAT family N-acetyltransferase n=1 Tax=Sphingomonas swuensis TaxID=977800 RepID=A0ABP7SCM1_9SPHN